VADLALVQRSRARCQPRGDAQRLGTGLNRTTSTSNSLARQGVALYNSPETNRNAALVSSPAAIKVVHPLPGVYGSVALSQDGSLVAVGNLRGEGAVVDTTTYRAVGSLPGQPLAISSDGRVFVDTAGPGTVIVDPKLVSRSNVRVSAPLGSWINPISGATVAVNGSLAFGTRHRRSDRPDAGPKGRSSVAAYTGDGHLITVQRQGIFWITNFVLRDAVNHRVEGTVR
jgi:hypothetical protein